MLIPQSMQVNVFEEGGDAFAGFRRGAQVGDAVSGVIDQRVVDRPAADSADQILGCGLGKRATLQQRVDDFLNLGIELFRLDGFMNEADFAGAGSIDAFGRLEVAVSLAGADGAQNVRRMADGMMPNLTSEVAKTALVEATAMSQAAARPMPPPRAAP